MTPYAWSSAWTRALPARHSHFGVCHIVQHACARFLVRLLGRRLGRVRLLLDAWFMRARLIEAALADGHTVIGRARRDLALYAVPRPPRQRRRGRPRKYGPRMTRARIEALPVHRSARVLYGRLEVVR